VKGVAYARNGCQLATINDDGLVRFWDLLGAQCPESNPLQRELVQEAEQWYQNPCAIALGDEDMACCTFSPSGRVLAVGTKESRVSFYLAPRVTFTLKHLARMALRRHQLSTASATRASNEEEVEEEGDHLLPNPLKAYLSYEQWH